MLFLAASILVAEEPRLRRCGFQRYISEVEARLAGQHREIAGQGTAFWLPRMSRACGGES